MCEEVLSLEARERNLAARERGVQGEVEAAGLGRVEAIAELDVHGVFGQSEGAQR